MNLWSGEKKIPPYYQGQKWDAPMTDDAVEHDIASLGLDCVLCQEPILEGENALLFFQPYHLECQLRVGMGDIQHLEKRCLCFRGSGNEITYDSDHYETYRDSARAAMEWILEHRQGRFHSD